jgi:hypothetical protein
MPKPGSHPPDLGIHLVGRIKYRLNYLKKENLGEGQPAKEKRMTGCPAKSDSILSQARNTSLTKLPILVWSSQEIIKSRVLYHYSN